MDTYIRNHEDDFIGQAEESVPIKFCRRLFELFDIDTDWRYVIIQAMLGLPFTFIAIILLSVLGILLP